MGVAQQRRGTTLVVKAIAFLCVLCLAELAAGSCLHYGNSCWGAHGKRSQTQASEEDQKAVQKSPESWYFARLFGTMPVQGLGLRRQLAIPAEIRHNNFEANPAPGHPSAEYKDIVSRQKFLENIEDLPAEELFPARPRDNDEVLSSAVSANKIRLMQLMREAVDEN